MRRPERIRRAGRLDPKTGKPLIKPYWVYTVTIPKPGGVGKNVETFRTKAAADARCAQLERERNGGIIVNSNKTFGLGRTADDDVLPEFRRSEFGHQRSRAVKGYEAALQR